MIVLKFENFINENKNNFLLELEEYLEQFPNDAKSWGDATDEVRDIARYAKEIYNEFNEDNQIEAMDFRSIKTPSEWNTKGKEYIFKVYNMMDNQSKEHFEKYIKGYIS